MDPSAAAGAKAPLNPRFNAFFKHGEAELFLARRDGRVVGRISAQVDRAFNDYQQNRWGMFGFLELENDPEVLGALLDGGRGLAARARADRIVGPMDFTQNDEIGILWRASSAADGPPALASALLPRAAGGAGLAKEVDLFMWELHISGKEKVLPVIWELADKLESEHGIRLRRMRRRSLRRTSTSSARSTTRPGRGTGASCPSPRPTSTPTPRSCTWCSTPTGSWWPSATNGRGRGGGDHSPDMNQVQKRMNGRLLPLGWLVPAPQDHQRCRVGFLGSGASTSTRAWRRPSTRSTSTPPSAPA